MATMVFADLVGSTELATALDPEDFRARLEPFFDVARDVLTEYGGTLEKFIGDAVVAAFGVPRSHGDDPDCAVAAAFESIRCIDERGDGLTLRIGIESGEVLAVEGGGDLDIAGEAVNAAARLQTAAQPGEVLVGERTARSCRGSELEPHEPIAAKGFPAPLAAWRAVGIASKARLAVTPFLGRDVELDLLRLAYRRAITERAANWSCSPATPVSARHASLTSSSPSSAICPSRRGSCSVTTRPTAAGSPSGRSAKCSVTRPVSVATPRSGLSAWRSRSGSPASARPTPAILPRRFPCPSAVTAATAARSR